MPSNVRVTNPGGSSNGDSHAAGRGRLRLKLAAIAYSTARHGIDADVRLLRSALALLCLAAFEYYEACTGADPSKRPVDPYLDFDNGKRASAAVERARDRLQLGAMAYGGARHGIDADAGMARAGLAIIAQASMEYYESFAGAEPSKRPVDALFAQIGGGAP